MKRYIAILFSIIAVAAHGQAIYRPSYTPLFTVASKPYAISQGAPVDGRSYKADSINFLWRPYNGTTEVLSYLPGSIPAYRTGQFPIEVNVGGTLNSNGTFTGGYIYEYWFRGGIADSNLVLKSYWPTNTSGFLQAVNNLSDVDDTTTAQTNLGLGTMAKKTATAGGDLTGLWPAITVADFNGELPSYYLNYNNLTNKPTIPAQVNITAGVNITVGGIYPNIIISALASVSPTLYQVTHAGNVADTSIYGDSIVGTQGLYNLGLNVGDTILRSGDSSMFWGNSVTEGYYASPLTLGYAYLSAGYLNTFCINRGISGTTLQQVSSGDSSFQNRLYGNKYAAVYDPTFRYIFIDYGINDCDLIGGISLPNYKTIYNNILDTLISDRGWPASKIVLIAPTLIAENSFGKNADSLLPFVEAVDSIGAARGLIVYDAFHYMLSNGGDALLHSDSIHPSTYGHFVVAQGLMYALHAGPVRIEGPTYTSDIVDFNRVNVNAPYLAANGTIRDTIGGVYGDITVNAPFTGFTHLILHNGTATGGFIVNAATDNGTGGIVGFETATNMTPAGNYNGGYGIGLYSTPTVNYIRSYGGDEAFTTGKDFEIINNAGTTSLHHFASNGHLSILSDIDNGYNLNVPGTVNIGNGTPAEGLVLTYPPSTTTANTTLFALTLTSGDTNPAGTVEYMPIYSAGGMVDSALFATINTARRIADSASANRPHTIFAPSNAGSVNLVDNRINIINPTGTLTSVTLNLPGSPANNDIVQLKFTQTITTITYSGGTVVGGLATSVAGSYTILTYDSATTSWY